LGIVPWLLLHWSGEAMMPSLFHSLLLVGYVLLAGIVVHLFVLFYEEPQLARRFGKSYET
jgi:protein-S-isoprenylcysteine O-methyltransferase Ste14